MAEEKPAKIIGVGFIPPPPNCKLIEVWSSGDERWEGPFVGWEQTVRRYRDGVTEVNYEPLVTVDGHGLTTLYDARKYWATRGDIQVNVVDPDEEVEPDKEQASGV